MPSNMQSRTEQIFQNHNLRIHSLTSKNPSISLTFYCPFTLSLHSHRKPYFEINRLQYSHFISAKMKTTIFTSTITVLATIVIALLSRVSAAPFAHPCATGIESIAPIGARTDASSPLRREVAAAELAAREAEAEAGPEAFVEASTVARTPEDWIIRAREAE